MALSKIHQATEHVVNTFDANRSNCPAMNTLSPRPLLALITLTLGLWANPAHAGRPLAVDDANVNEKGAGHVEIWVARDSHKVDTWNLAPAFAPVDGVEIGVAYAKARKNGQAEQAIQAKWRITPSQENGCNVASTLGTVHEKTVGSSPYWVGILTCNSALGAVHVNLTGHQPKGEKNYNSWGVAFERAMGSVTPHLEIFGDDGSRPTLQFGAKTEIKGGLQLDATLGRDHQNKANVFSLGFKLSF
jgi:hypothetical protein